MAGVMPPGGWYLSQAIQELPGDAAREPVLLSLETREPVGLSLVQQLCHFEVFHDGANAERVRRALRVCVCVRVMRDEVIATGIKAGETKKERIEPEFVNSADWDYEYSALSLGGVTYRNVQMSPAPLPLAGIAPGATHAPGIPTASAAPPHPPTPIKDVGGRPSKIPDAFTKEIVRIADLDGIDSKRALTKRMLEWSAQHYPDIDERTVRRWVAKFCPDEIPP